MAKQSVLQAKAELKRWIWSTILTFLAGFLANLLANVATLQEMGAADIKQAAIIGILLAAIRAGLKAINEKLIVKRQ